MQQIGVMAQADASELELLQMHFQAHFTNTGGILCRSDLKRIFQRLGAHSMQCAMDDEALDALLNPLFAHFKRDSIHYNDFLKWLLLGEMGALQVRPSIDSPSKAVDEGACMDYTAFDTLGKVIQSGDVDLIRGDWIVKLAECGGRLPRCQDLPSEAIWSDEQELIEGLRNYTVRLVSVSHCWFTEEHPDPDGRNLEILGVVLTRFLASAFCSNAAGGAAVFLDWTSLPQKPRTDEQEARFSRALKSINVWYAHPCSIVWMLTARWPGIVPYGARGWPHFERAISSLIARTGYVLDLGKLETAELPCYCVNASSPSTGIVGICTAHRTPPVHPNIFEAEIASRTVTNGADKALLVHKYAQVFRDVMGNARLLDFTSLKWGDAEVMQLSSALPACGCLAELRLSNNRLTDAGAVQLAKVLPACNALVGFWLYGNSIGDEGAVALALVIPECALLNSLDLRFNPISDEGKWHLRNYWQKSGKTIHDSCSGSLSQAAFGLGLLLDSGEVMYSIPLERGRSEVEVVRSGKPSTLASIRDVTGCRRPPGNHGCAPVEIMRGLWTAHFHDMESAKALSRISPNISTVINCATEKCPTFPGHYGETVEVLRVESLLDDPEELKAVDAMSEGPEKDAARAVLPVRPQEECSGDAKRDFERVNDAIASTKRQGGSVMVHCHASISRSVAFIAAYIMRSEAFSATEALQVIKQKWNATWPNTTFVNQLLEYEAELTAEGLYS